MRGARWRGFSPRCLAGGRPIALVPPRTAGEFREPVAGEHHRDGGHALESGALVEPDRSAIVLAHRQLTDRGRARPRMRTQRTIIAVGIGLGRLGYCGVTGAPDHCPSTALMPSMTYCTARAANSTPSSRESTTLPVTPSSFAIRVAARKTA